MGDGGSAITALQRCFQLVCRLENEMDARFVLAKLIAGGAAKLGSLGLLRKALESLPTSGKCELSLFDDVSIALNSKSDPQEGSRKDQVTFQPASRQTPVLANGFEKPWYELKVPYYWVGDESSMNMVQMEIEQKVSMLADGQKVWLAIDTEWGDQKESSHGGPSIVQIALIDCVWILDTAVLSEQLQRFFRWIFTEQHLLRLGFAFGHDIVKLTALLGDIEDRPSIEVLDLQKLTMNDSNRAFTPGLKSVAATYLGVSLDKHEQCSDWHRRPLTESQLKYAAADAAILLDVAQAMQVKG